jgi:Ca2+-binding RTX toxin-like protein
LAFTTINGASATDAVSFVGTDGNDILTTFNTLTAFVGAQAGNDTITASAVNGLADWQVKGGADADTINFQSAMVGGRVNGNAGSDTLNLGDVLSGAEVFGGQGGDFINVGTVADSRVNGNIGEDIITVGSNTATGLAAISNASIFGGQGSDQIDLYLDLLEGSVIGGNLGNDFINLYYDKNARVSGVSVKGGAGDDTINASLPSPSGVAGVGKGEGLNIDGGEGNDTIIASGRNDTISGGLGDDTITGRAGADAMTGGGGKNIFRVEFAQDTWVNSGNADAPIAGFDSIIDWTTDTTAAPPAAGVAPAADGSNNGDTLAFGPGGFAVGVTYADTKALVAALTGAVFAEGVTLVGVGSDTSLTAFAVTVDAAGTTPAGDAPFGVIQLGADGKYTVDTYKRALTADQVAAF